MGGAAAAVDPALVDPSALAAWMDAEGLGEGRITGLRPIGGGTQNVIVRFERGCASYVLRRGPERPRPRTNATLAREMRVLAALAATDVPHPALIAGCADPSVLGGSAFYLMEPVDGFNPMEDEHPPLYASDARARHRLGLAVADALASVGAADHEALGLADLGRPVGFLERQVPRWLGELESFQRLDGYDGSRLPGAEIVAGWLDRNRPATWTPGLLHGDFHLGNLICAREQERVLAVVDWEMCTIGDPLIDLGWLLVTWPVGGSSEAPRPGTVGHAGGMPGPEELVARYAQRSPRDLSALPWYEVLACFKLGIVLEGTHARACAGLAPRATGDRLHAAAMRLFDSAHALMDGGRR